MLLPLTLICTWEPLTKRHMVRPACELYRDIGATDAAVLDREYRHGVYCYTVTKAVPHTVFASIDAIDEYF